MIVRSLDWIAKTRGARVLSISPSGAQCSHIIEQAVKLPSQLLETSQLGQLRIQKTNGFSFLLFYFAFNDKRLDLMVTRIILFFSSFSSDHIFFFLSSTQESLVGSISIGMCASTRFQSFFSILFCRYRFRLRVQQFLSFHKLSPTISHSMFNINFCYFHLNDSV